MKSRLLLLLLFTPFLFSCGGKEKKPLTPTQQHASDIAKRLKKLGLFAASSDEQIDSLVVHYGNDSLNGLYTMLEKSGDLLVTGLTLNGQSTEQFYTKLFQQTSARVPDATIQSVSTEMRIERVNELDVFSDTSYIVTLKTKDTSYHKSLFYTSLQPVDNDFYKYVNQVLVDRNSKLRLFPIDFTCLTCKRDTFGRLPHDVTKLGLIALTNVQYDSLMTMEEDFNFFDNEFMLRSSREIRDEQAKLLHSGLLDGFPESYLQRYNRDLEENFFYSKEDMFDYAEDTLFTSVIIDSTETYEPYTLIANSLSAISREKFDLGDADETHTANGTIFRCTINGKPHTYSLVAQNGYVDPKFIDHINTALEDEGAGGAFYSVNHGQQEAELVFIPDTLLNKVKQSKCFDELEKGLPEDVWRRYNGKLSVRQ